MKTNIPLIIYVSRPSSQNAGSAYPTQSTSTKLDFLGLMTITARPLYPRHKKGGAFFNIEKNV